MNMSFLKKKKFYIPAIIVLLAAGIAYRSYSKSNAPVQYDTIEVEKADLRQTVDATGKVEAVQDLALRFEVPGILTDIKVKENDQVKAGQWLANLRLSEYNAAVAQAAANLNQKLAGASTQDRQYYQAAVDSAKASLEQSKTDTVNAIATAESAVETAKNNLKLAEGGDNSQIVNNAYQNAVTSLQAAQSTVENALTQADNILGIENTLANDSFDEYLAILDSSRLAQAKSNYLITKEVVNKSKAGISGLNTNSAHSIIDQAILLVQESLTKDITLLSSVADVLSVTAPVGSLTQSSLDALKTTIDTTRTSVNTQYTSIVAKAQAISDAKNSFSTYSIAYNKSINDLEEAKNSAVTAVAIKQAAYDQAVATLKSKIDPPREIDVAALRAAVAQASASRDKAIIRAPFDGKVTKVNKEKGELISAADEIVHLSSPHYEISVDIPETDITKIKLSDPAVITLDAFGDDIKLSGKVLNMELASTEIQDVVYYRVTVSLDDTDKPVKTGMTANVSLSTDSRSGVLVLPLRAVRTGDKRYVQVLENGQPQDVEVRLGMRADDGRVEILSGLSEGQDVVLGVKEK